MGGFGRGCDRRDKAVWLPTLFWVLKLWLARWLAGLVWRVDPMCWFGRQAGNLGREYSVRSSRRRTESEAARKWRGPLQE
jgi:hypothetical protein